MARKRRAPSPAPPPPPPPPPPRESSTEHESDTEEEEGSPPIAVTQKPPPENPQPHPSAAAAAGGDAYLSEEESDSDADAQGFQMIPVSRSPTKPAAPAPQAKSHSDEEEDGESSESEAEAPEPVQKKVAATKKSKAVEQEDKKRPAPEPAPSGKAKKAKAEAGKAAPDANPAGKGKKAKSEPEKAAPEKSPSGKAKKPVGKLDNSGLNSPPQSSKSERTPRNQRTSWSKEDLMKILEALATHVKNEGALPKTDVLLAALRDRLDRKECTYADLYEKIRRFKARYEKQVSTRDEPKEEDELRMYKLSEAIWGEKAKEAIAAAASQNDPAVTKSKKGQAKKEKMDGNSKSGEVANQNSETQKGYKKRQTIEAKADRDLKPRLSEDTTTGSPSKSKKQGNDKDKLGKNKDSKSGTSKETTTTVSQNGDALMKRKRGKMDKEKMDVDLMPKENGGTRTEEEIHEEDTESGAGVHATSRSFDELQDLYPNLADYVESIKAHHPCGQTLRRAFGLIGDEKANALELRIKAQRMLELKAEMREDAIRKDIVNSLIGLAN